MIRKSLGKGLGALILGLGLAQEAQATEVGKDASYANLTRAETLQILAGKAERVYYQSFDKEVRNYNGAVLVLTTDLCSSGREEIIDRNMEFVYSQLIDKFADAKVNGLPIKFTWFNTCGRSGADLLGILGLETHMYLDGKKIDVRKGGPVNEEGIETAFQNMSIWVNYDLLNIKDLGDNNLVVLYKNGSQLKPYTLS
ncbi:hypothetical protein HZA98_04105, partial [Candidatus Woesearchaeota archaeon]|nr:hypothetical protein [Candidatus Woesearchaeota archaeon]